MPFVGTSSMPFVVITVPFHSGLVMLALDTGIGIIRLRSDFVQRLLGSIQCTRDLLLGTR